MVKYTYDHKTPLEAKVLLLLGISCARPSEFSYYYWGDNRIMRWKNGKRIHKDIRDYVKMVFVIEHNQVIRFAEFVYRNRSNKRCYRYVVSPFGN